MRCQRCHGLMVVDHFIDMEETGGLWMRAWRCVACGEVVDPRIMRHRMRQGRLSQFAKAVTGRRKHDREVVHLSA